MKIRTQFIITMSLFGLILIIMAASLIVTNRQVDRLHEQEEIAHNIERGASDLSYLSNDYLLYRESQQRARWESKFSSFSKDVSQLNPASPDQQVLVNQIKANQERLKAVFSNVVSTLESASRTRDAAAEMAFVQVSWSRMQVQNQAMVFDALLLSEKLRDQVDRLKHTNMVLIFVLVGIFGAYFLTNYLLIYRRTLRSLSDLRAGTEIIGSGNLDFTIPDTKADEIGELSRAFNRMTRNLRDVTASKADLEREIAEREQAEQALTESRRRLSVIVDSIVDGFYALDREWRFTHINDAALRYFRRTREAMLGRTIFEVFPGVRGSVFEVEYCRAFESNQPVHFETPSVVTDRTVAMHAYPGPDNLTVLFRDVTERHRMEAALRESEEKYRSLFNAMTEGFAIHELIADDRGQPCDYRFLDINPAFERLTGLRRADVVGKTHNQVLPDNDPKWVHIYGEVAITGQPVHFEDYSPALERHYEVFAYRNAPRQFAVIFMDVTQRKQTEEALRESEERYRTLLDQAPDAILVHREGRIVYCNAAALRLYAAASPDQLLGMDPLLLVHPDAREEARTRVASVLKRGRSPLREFQHVRLDGQEVPVETVGAPVDWQGKPAVQAIIRDITERRQAEIERERLLHQLEAERALLLAIINNAPEGIVVTDPSSHIVLTNPAAERLYARPVPYGQSYDRHAEFSLCYPDGTAYDPRHLPLTRSALDGETHTEVEMAVVWPDGQRRALLVNTAPILNDKGHIMGAVGIFQDITERKRAEERLVRQAEDLARSNKELEQFAYVASHDLQEPLRMVASYVQLLAERYQGHIDERADRYIAYAVDGAKRMKLLINDLLAYSRVGTHGKPLVPTDSQAVLAEVLANLQVSIEEQQATVTHDPLPTVLADRVQLGQLFQNLIVNGLKFCGDAPPRIHVGAERDAECSDTSSGRGWRFFVSDNGIGLEPKYVERIFVIFQRLHGPADYPGTGIGLAICKKIVERHGGRIWVESQPGQGATFYFTMPGV